MIRAASSTDLSQLVELENQAFDSDRLSKRNFKHMLNKANGDLLVQDDDGIINGYALVLYHRGTHLARLYSIAVADRVRGRGIGRALLDAAEAAAIKRGCISMRLEIRLDNNVGEKLYRAAGYREFGTYLDYYEDHSPALRMEKPLARHLDEALSRVPYYQQSTDFTCGPASLLMAMSALDETITPDRRQELQLWRESTSIFMTTGHGGCGPLGMALAAHRRGFKVEVWLSDAEAMFLDSVRNEEKKAVIQLVHEDFSAQAKAANIKVNYQPLTFEEIRQQLADGGIPIVLISSAKIYKERFPHWVVITGIDDAFIYAHDPYVDADKGKSVMDSTAMPIKRSNFLVMARWGKHSRRAALTLKRGD